MRWLLAVALLLALSIMHVISLGRSAEEMKALPIAEESAYVLPSSVLKISTLGFKDLVSDFMFLKALVFLGSAAEQKQGLRAFKGQQWRWVYNVLDTATDLDPYFLDPYYTANAYLPWDAGMTKETNALLGKGSTYRDWDPYLPFFLGFNCFYFLHDNEKASEWLMTAARRPGANTLYANLAARLAYESKRTENAIMFLEELLRNTDDEELQERYKTRLIALQGVSFLEKAVVSYKEKFHRNPADLDALIKKGVIKAIPKDPYGGTFYIDTEGMIKTTSDFKLQSDPK